MTHFHRSRRSSRQQAKKHGARYLCCAPCNRRKPLKVVPEVSGLTARVLCYCCPLHDKTSGAVLVHTCCGDAYRIVT